MKLIPLNHKQSALVDDDVYEELSKYKWHANYSSLNGSFYAMRTSRVVGGYKKFTMHRVIIDCPVGMVIDHINHNTLDNRRINLRVCTHSQNCMNRGPTKNNKSGYKGVSLLHKKYDKWGSVITVNKKTIWLGTFSCKHEAALAYNEAARKYHGEFAYQNVINKKAT